MKDAFDSPLSIDNKFSYLYLQIPLVIEVRLLFCSKAFKAEG